MVEPAELKPAELDRVEDALELLELTDVDDPSPAVRDRLGDFRRILQLSRSALPSVDVPGAVLARVMAEARLSTEMPALAPQVEDIGAPARPGLWTRLRRFALLPGVALVGAAAMVLIIVERAPQDTVAAPAAPDGLKTSAQAGELDERTRTVVVPSGPQGAAANQDQAPAPGLVAPSPEVAAASEAQDPAAPPPSPAAVTPTSAPERKADAAETDGRKGAEASGEAEKEELADTPADGKLANDDDNGPPRWDIIARGDRARQQNDCKGARTEYKLALGDADARVRARAHAGIGLCAAFDGDASAADSAYKAARELDPEISGFIDSERPRGGGTGSSNAARSKSSPKKASKAKAAPPQNADAYEPE